MEVVIKGEKHCTGKGTATKDSNQLIDWYDLIEGWKPVYRLIPSPEDDWPASSSQVPPWTVHLDRSTLIHLVYTWRLRFHVLQSWPGSCTGLKLPVPFLGFQCTVYFFQSLGEGLFEVRLLIVAASTRAHSLLYNAEQPVHCTGGVLCCRVCRRARYLGVVRLRFPNQLRRWLSDTFQLAPGRSFSRLHHRVTLVLTIVSSFRPEPWATWVNASNGQQPIGAPPPPSHGRFVGVVNWQLSSPLSTSHWR